MTFPVQDDNFEHFEKQGTNEKFLYYINFFAVFTIYSIVTCWVYVTRQVTSRRIGYSEFTPHSLLQSHNLQSHNYNYCHRQYHNFFYCSPFYTTQ
jgi:hypothetical protein